MAEITAALVKELRERTGAGMMDCKRALVETEGDLEQAIDWLRKKGLSAAAKKAGRVAAEGLVGVVTAGRSGAILEVNSETDFVARTPKFQEFVVAATRAVGEHDVDVEALKASILPEFGTTTEQHLTHLVATIGENMTLRRAKRLSVDHGIVVSYVHNAVQPGLGRIGVLVALESRADLDRLDALGKEVAMHIAAAGPLFLDIASVDGEALKREIDVYREQARASGKPEAIIEKMVEGRVQKYYEQAVLLKQVSCVREDKTKISDVIEAVSLETGHPIQIASFARFALGEGIERPAADPA
jgi:elongation factor Ts